MNEKCLNGDVKRRCPHKYNMSKECIRHVREVELGVHPVSGVRLPDIAAQRG